MDHNPKHRIRIAELTGAKWYIKPTHADEHGRIKGEYRFLAFNYGIDGKMHTGAASEYERIPDYLNDTEAMLEVQDWLWEQCKKNKNYSRFNKYCDRLVEIVGGQSERYALIKATAAQRAEAFLKTMGAYGEPIYC